MNMARNQDLEIVDTPREPLLQNQNALLDGKIRDDASLMLYLSTFVAVCGSFEFGACVGFSAPAQFSIIDDLKLTYSEYAVFGSILNLGAILGAISCGYVADFLGRKGAMRISSLLCGLGWLVIYSAKGSLALDFGRLLTGYGCGGLSYVVPVFIAEISPKSLRGSLATLNQLFIVSGLAAMFIVGVLITWRSLALTGIIPCAFLLVGTRSIPESPRWLEMVGQHDDFHTALQILRGPDLDVSEEAEEIKENLTTLSLLPKATPMDLIDKRNIRLVGIGVGLMVFQQCTGVNGINFYAQQIFETAGVSPNLGSLLYSVEQVFVTALGATMLIDKLGRRPLLIISSSGMLAGCLFIGTSFALKANDCAIDLVTILALLGVLAYIGSYSIGMGAIPWVIMSEIYPINLKGIAGGLVTFTNWSCSWLVSFTFNLLMSWSPHGTFSLYGGLCMVAVVFITKMVPETKGRALEEIQARSQN